MSRILVVDDDGSIRAGLAALLTSEGYEVDAAARGLQALDLFHQRRPDLVLLDLLMPGMSGLEVCQHLRQEDLHLPIIMLTAKAEESDKVLGLELGADDYITKPFGTAELLARIKAALRRSQVGPAVPAQVVSGDLAIDFTRRDVCMRGQPVTLTGREYDLLAFLVEHRQRLVTREELLVEVWGYERADRIDTRTVDKHVGRLRRKLEPDPDQPRYLVTVRGAGYRFEGE